MPSGLDRSPGVLDVVGQVYAAAENDALWDSVASAIARASGSTGAALLSLDDGVLGVLARTPNVDNAWLIRYQDHYRRLISRFPCREITPPPAAPTDEPPIKVVDFRFDGPLAPESPHGLGSLIPMAPGESVLLGVHRRCGAPRYDAAERDRIARLLPHLERALRLRHRLQRQAIAASAAFDRLDRSAVATFVAGRDRRIFYANPAAEVLLRAGDGIEIIGGRIATGSRALTERLTRMIASAIDTAPGGDMSRVGMLAVPRDCSLPLTVLVTPLRAADQSCPAKPDAAIMLVRDPAARRLACGPLQSLFGLTAAEAAIASALAAGSSVNEIAASNRISPHTARVHLKSIFGKTGTSRQGQLVSLLLCSVAGIASQSASLLN